MLKVIAKQKVLEGRNDEFEAVAKELVALSKAEERNVDYSINHSVDDPSLYCFIEVWEDKAALEAHMASEHFRRLAPQLGGFVVEGSAQMELYTLVS